VAAVGHDHMRDAVAAAEAAYSARALGGLLHLALRARCLATLDLLLGLAAHGCAPRGRCAQAQADHACPIGPRESVVPTGL